MCRRPIKEEPSACISENPIIQKKKVPAIKSTKFFIRMLAVFLLRVNPASTRANPGCIKNTSIEASNTHTVSSPLIVVISIALSSSIFYLPEPSPRVLRYG